MAVFLLAAGAGLLGQSKFAWKKISFASNTFRYSKFVRMEATSELRLEVPAAEELVRVWISNEYLTSLQLDTIHPIPSESVNRDDGVEYEFKSYGGALNVVFGVTPQAVGTLTGEVSVNDSPKQTFTQFSYF